MAPRKASPQGRGRALHDGATRFLSVVLMVLGVLLALRGAALAVVLGVAMVGAGAARLWVLAQQRPRR